MSELGNLINEAIDKAQEFAGEMKEAGDKAIDVVQEQAPAIAESARSKTEEMAAAAREAFPGVVDEAKEAGAFAADAAKSAVARATGKDAEGDSAQ